MANYGYIRTDYPIPTSEQIELVTNYQLDNLFIEAFDFQEDSELEKCLQQAHSQDYLIISDLRVFGKIKIKFKELLQTLNHKGIYLISVNDQIDTSENKHFYANNLSVIDMFEKQHSVAVIDSIKQARSEGKAIGRPTLDSQTIQKMKELYDIEGKTPKEISKLYKVSIATVYKYVYNPEQPFDNKH